MNDNFDVLERRLTSYPRRKLTEHYITSSRCSKSRRLLKMPDSKAAREQAPEAYPWGTLRMLANRERGQLAFSAACYSAFMSSRSIFVA